MLHMLHILQYCSKCSSYTCKLKIPHITNKMQHLQMHFYPVPAYDVCSTLYHGVVAVHVLQVLAILVFPILYLAFWVFMHLDRQFRIVVTNLVFFNRTYIMYMKFFSSVLLC